MSLLRVERLNKSFGGLKATDNISFTVAPGELGSIIGPNGAGKTTLFNLITGYLRPDSGRVFFNGRDITHLPPHAIVRLGIGRSFQRSNIFARLTVFENVQAAVLSHHRQSSNLWRATHRYRELNDRAERILGSVGLLERRNQLSGTLALGDQKRLEMGLALALEPQLMLLDEPTAGMSPEETWSTVALIEILAREFKMTVLFTEHDMAVVFDISQKIRVLHQGQFIAEGVPQEISENPEVQRVYLGEKREERRFVA
jgi:branched-chain amino acid transport system ATP-binding protein